MFCHKLGSQGDEGGGDTERTRCLLGNAAGTSSGGQEGRGAGLGTVSGHCDDGSTTTRGDFLGSSGARKPLSVVPCWAGWPSLSPASVSGCGPLQEGCDPG